MVPVKMAQLRVFSGELIRRDESGGITTEEAKKLASFLVTTEEAKKLASFLVLESASTADGELKATYFRRESELREMGLVLADEFYEPVEVRLEKVIEKGLGTSLCG